MERELTPASCLASVHILLSISFVTDSWYSRISQGHEREPLKCSQHLTLTIFSQAPTPPWKTVPQTQLRHQDHSHPDNQSLA